MNGFQKTLAATTLLVGFGQAAHAADLFTPASESGDGTSLVCTIVNTGNKPVSVSANVLNFYDGSDATMGTNCPASPATLPPGAGCTAHGTYSGPHAGYCRFSAQGGKVRGALLVIDTQGYVTSSLPAVK